MKKMNNHKLKITWAKAFGEIYCHHANLIIPYTCNSLFEPTLVRVGLTVRNNQIVNRKISSYVDKTTRVYLPCEFNETGLCVPLNSTEIIDGLSLNSWTTFKNKVRGVIKEFAIGLSYKIEDNPEVSFSFIKDEIKTPFLISEQYFTELNDGGRIDVDIKLD